jgi:excisionase family DNA binding protein
MQSQSSSLPEHNGNEILFYSIKDTCRITSLGRTKVYSMLLDGTLKARKIGNRRLILAESVRALINPEG